MHSLADAPTDVLFGLMALHNDLIAPATAAAALRARHANRTVSEILVAEGGLTARQRDLVEKLCDEYIEQHGGDARQGLAAFVTAGSVRERLDRVGDPELTVGLESLATTGVAGTAGDELAAGDCPRFRVLRPHAKGGIGEVFVALDAELNREVALKRIQDRRADDPRSRARFLLEAEVTGGLEHPGIVPVYSLGRNPGGRPYYAMRFIRGESLKEAVEQFHRGNATWVKRHDDQLSASPSPQADLGDSPRATTDPGSRSLELRNLLRRFTDVCNAIEYSHSRGVLHRDIKPGNVIVGKHGETLVVDWGLANAMGRVEPVSQPGELLLTPCSAGGSAETLPGSVLGTPAYMSPEQAAGELDRLGPASDVYSLGATLYCLLTGEPPYQGGTDEVLGAVQKGEFATPRALDPTIDPALEAVCLKAMAKKPKGRYASCRALAEDLERWAADEPVSAWREPLAWRARRWARRNRKAVTGAAAALAVGVIGLSAVALVQARANNDLREANAATTTEKIKSEMALVETRSAKKVTEEALAQKGVALAQSEESRQRAESVLNFLKNDVLAAARPEGQEGGLGVEVTVRKVVDAAEPKIAGTFEDQPIVEAEVRGTLGQTRTLVPRRAPLAIRQLERAV